MTGLLGQAAEQITRDRSRDAAREELLKPEYHVDEPSLLDRIVNRVLAELSQLLAEAIEVVPGHAVGLIVILVVVFLLFTAWRLGLRPRGFGDRLTDRRRRARSMTADDYRAEADRLAAAGDWKHAVRARFRAIVRELEQRGILDPRPGRTAGEICRETVAAVPAVSAPMRSAAYVFDAVWYGERPATPGDDDAMRAADAAVRGARLAVVAR